MKNLEKVIFRFDLGNFAFVRVNGQKIKQYEVSKINKVLGFILESKKSKKVIRCYKSEENVTYEEEIQINSKAYIRDKG